MTVGGAGLARCSGKLGPAPSPTQPPCRLQPARPPSRPPSAGLANTRRLWPSTAGPLSYAGEFNDNSEQVWTLIELDVDGPPRMATTPDGHLEDERWCVPGEEVVTRFELVRVPGTDALVPVYFDGEARFVGTEIESIQVVDWGEDGELELEHHGREVHLSPEADEVGLWVEEGTRIWVEEGTRFMQHSRRSSAGVEGVLPVVEVRGRCMAEDPEVREVEAGVDELVPGLDVAGVVRVEGERVVVEVEGSGMAWVASTAELEAGLVGQR